MLPFLIVFGLLGFIVFSIMAIISKFKKTGKAKKKMIFAGIGFAVMMIAIVASPAPDKGTLAGPVSTPAVTQKVLNSPKATAMPKVTATAAPTIKESPVATIKITPKESSTISPAPTVTTKPTVTPVATAVNDPDKSFLQALDGITYNTFVEASNIGDQLTGYSKLKYSRDDLDNFFQDDAVLWRLYSDDIKKVEPTDLTLVEAEKGILFYLGDLQDRAAALSDHFKNNDLANISEDGNAMVLDFNKLKEQYAIGVSQMSKFGIDSNWRP